MTHLTSFKATKLENFIPYNPELAAKVGTLESLVLQLIRGWMQQNANNNKNFVNNKYWTYNSIDEWQKYFPGESESTVRRAFLKLEKAGYLISDNHNKNKFDRTKWYTVDLQKYDDLLKPRNNAFVQNEQMEVTNLNSSLYTYNNNIKEKEIFNLEDWSPTAKDREEMVKKTGLDEKIILNALQEFKLHHQAYTQKVIQDPDAAFELWCMRRPEVKRRYTKPQVVKEVTKQTKYQNRHDYLQSRFEENRRISNNASNQDLITAEHIGDLAKKMRR